MGWHSPQFLVFPRERRHTRARHERAEAPATRICLPTRASVSPLEARGGPALSSRCSHTRPALLAHPSARWQPHACGGGGGSRQVLVRRREGGEPVCGWARKRSVPVLSPESGAVVMARGVATMEHAPGSKGMHVRPHSLSWHLAHSLAKWLPCLPVQVRITSPARVSPVRSTRWSSALLRKQSRHHAQRDAPLHASRPPVPHTAPSAELYVATGSLALFSGPHRSVLLSPAALHGPRALSCHALVRSQQSADGKRPGRHVIAACSRTHLRVCMHPRAWVHADAPLKTEKLFSILASWLPEALSESTKERARSRRRCLSACLLPERPENEGCFSSTPTRWCAFSGPAHCAGKLLSPGSHGGDRFQDEEVHRKAPMALHKRCSTFLYRTYILYMHLCYNKLEQAFFLIRAFCSPPGRSAASRVLGALLIRTLARKE